MSTTKKQSKYKNSAEIVMHCYTGLYLLSVSAFSSVLNFSCPTTFHFRKGDNFLPYDLKLIFVSCYASEGSHRALSVVKTSNSKIRHTASSP